MSMNINDSKISNYYSIYKEKKSGSKTFSQKSKQQEEPIKNEGSKMPLNNNLISTFNSNNSNILNLEEENKIVQKQINNINNNNNQISVLHSSKKNLILFNILKKKKKIRKDDIEQTIIRHFIKFFFYFVNFYIKTKVKEKKIELRKDFKIIYYKDKDTIKIKHILELTIEQLLLFKPKEKNKNNNKNENQNDNNKRNNQNDNKSDEKNDNKKKIGKERIKKSYFSLNEELLKEIKNNIAFSLDNFFESRLIDLFTNIYSKKRKEIDLKKYDIKSKLPKIIRIFEDLKKNNKNKEKIMDDIINKKIVCRRNIFKTNKKE